MIWTRSPTWFGPMTRSPTQTPATRGPRNAPEIVGDEHLAGVEWRIAARKGVLKAMHPHEQLLESRKASVRAKVEHVFLIVKWTSGWSRPATAVWRRT